MGLQNATRTRSDTTGRIFIHDGAHILWLEDGTREQLDLPVADW